MVNVPPYTLSSCNGRVQTSGRRAKDYVVEALDASGQVELPVVVECDHIPDIREEIPTPEVALCHSHLADIAKSIPPVDKNSQILLLIGRDVPVAHHVLSQRIGPHNSPYAQRLRLGWVIVGETCLGKAHKPDYTVNKTFVLKNGRPSLFAPCSNELDVRDRQVSAQNVVNDDLASPVFITTETDNKIGTSVEDREFLQVMDEGFVKGPEGNWVAPLPFRKPRRRLPNNKGQAIKRAKTLHNSLLTNTLKRQLFFDFMQKIFDAGHAELAPPMKPEEECWYLPLFGVYHPKNPDQIRGVFDSSATHEGISLNDVLLKGPDLTNSLLGILQRFRKEPIAVTADIERMFYNFHVREDHRNYLRFLWYQDHDFENDLVDYRMKVHVFGNSPSPAVATYELRKAAEIGQEEFGQDVVNFVDRDFYVDDALMSLPTAEQAIDLLKRTQQALATGGNIRLHKIVSNSQEVIEAFPLSDHAKDIKNLDLGMDTIPLQRSLGLSWDLKTDSITFQVSSEQRPFSRRGVLSTINSLFDPIGFVAPVKTRGKVLLRELMTENVEWDDPLPPHREKEWDEWKQSLQCLSRLQIPRTYTTLAPATKEILIYSDASETAIAAVAYMRTTDHSENVQLGFVLGKAKLAPVHRHTIPRLELCATVLAIEIAEVISDQLDISLSSIRYFTDSKIVLGYIHNQSRRFYVYVSNRVERISRSSTPEQWSYVPTELNPADAATRSTSATDMDSSSWLLGPSQSPERTPDDSFPLYSPEGDKEIRPQNTTLQTNVSKTEFLGVERFQRFSSWRRLVKAIAHLKHIALKYQNNTGCSGWHTCSESKKVKIYTDTELRIMKQVQSEVYSKEIDCIVNKRALPKNSPIHALNPILDKDGVLRVGGRLNRSCLEVEGRNPIIIPWKAACRDIAYTSSS